MAAERMAVERMALSSLATDPLIRLQMAGINPEVSVWLQRKGGSQKLDPPPLFKGGGGSGSPESQPSPKSLNFLLILYFSRSFLEHVS